MCMFNSILKGCYRKLIYPPRLPSHCKKPKQKLFDRTGIFLPLTFVSKCFQVMSFIAITIVHDKVRFEIIGKHWITFFLSNKTVVTPLSSTTHIYLC